MRSGHVMAVTTVLVFALAALVASAPAHASERLMRRFDHDRGLPAPHVTALAQDENGFLWLGTAGGLVRWDGRDMRRIAPERITRRMAKLFAYPGGMIAGEEFGRVFDVDTKSGVATLLTDDAGGPLAVPWDLLVDRHGRLWVLTDDAVQLLDDRRHARRPLPRALEAEGPREIAEGADGTIYLGTTRGLWRVDAAGAAVRLTDIPLPADTLVAPDGSVYVLEWGAALLRWHDGRLDEVFRASNEPSSTYRGIALALRGDTLWAAYGKLLVAFRTGQPAERIDEGDGVPSGGPLLVDREGSLWVGSFRGLLQFPEPDTVAITEKEGLHGTFARSVTLAGDAVWASTWHGLDRIATRGHTVERIDPPGGAVRLPTCVDGRGALWGGSRVLLFAVARGVFSYFEAGGTMAYGGCVVDASGAVWLATRAGVYRSSGYPAPPVLVGTPPADDHGYPSAERITLDAHGELWVTQESRACHAPAAPLASGAPAEWSCHELGLRYTGDIRGMPSGTVWVTGASAGVLRFDGQGFVPVPGAARLASLQTYRLEPAAAGGVWLGTAGGLVRVVEDASVADGWRVLEQPGPWNGLPSAEIQDVAETADGGLWMASPGGVIWMPASARARTPAPPRLELVEVRADGRTAASGGIELAPHDNALELRFAALTFRDRQLLRYRMRLGGGAWSQPFDTPQLQLADLSPGPHTVAIAASLDGATWSEAATLAFAVRRPLWARPWPWICVGVLASVALGIAHRLRLAHQLRLERQRLRIAMDLHDEMGSGLGSIGVLAGVAANGVDEQVRRELAGRIAETAEELGGALGDIVWSLRQTSGSLGAAAARLTERACALFPDDAPALAIELPEPMPLVALSPAVARALQLCGQEALHNAAKHAQAEHVALRLRPAARGAWQLVVEDDGRGVGDGAPRPGTRSSGMGLVSMARRARAIGATLSVTAGAGGRGTRVSLVFDPRAEDGRVLDRLRTRGLNMAMRWKSRSGDET
jgi:signal transduction histidine kinase/ligand-binding sensor domain-containing protein